MLRKLTLASASLLFSSAALANTVAITEFQNDVNGDENTLEWIEIFNYGSTSVDLYGYEIADEDSDTFIVLSSITVPSGGYVILADDPAAFIAEWGVGTEGTNVFNVDITLANGADELVLRDAGAATVWSLAWADDDNAGYATWLTDTMNWSTTAFGSKAYPGVVRAGTDTTGTLGYESGLATADPNAITSYQGNVGSPLAGDYMVDGGVNEDPTISTSGSCPGPVAISVTNMTPSRKYAIVTGTVLGTTTVPGGPCAGTDIDLGNVTYRGSWTADATGENTLTPNLPAQACGLFIQALDISTCTPTNVANLP